MPVRRGRDSLDAAAVDFDVVVVGGGHAGIEAALAAARLGARTALVTHDRREIGRMACNPAVGGIGKGHLVREIDVLGGEMARAIDDTGIQFRILNRRKGPAVQAPRAQADKRAYRERMRAVVEAQPRLTVLEDDVVGLPVRSGRGPDRLAGVVGARLGRVTCRRAVLAAGTFLRGLMHVGPHRTRGGREGAASAEGLSAELLRRGFTLQRLKTGTSPRLARRSLDLDALTPQPGDPDPQPFSFRTRDFAPRQVLCHVARTTPRTHALIRANLDRSPLFAGAIEGRGPRYCPSIEDKVVRFPDRESHLLFLEPEGRDGGEIYVNGLSTSLPEDVQVAMVRSVAGLEAAELMRFGYAVEYDAVPSHQVVGPGLEARPLPGLHLAGQVLGTSGYEEAAAQGLIAGVSAYLSIYDIWPFRLSRSEAYLGVLIDDLTTKQIDEPYRMFTSRAEHRLHLRCDNAETRLAGHARRLGLLPPDDLELLERRVAAARRSGTVLRRRRGAGGAEADAAGGAGSADGGTEPGREPGAILEGHPDAGLRRALRAAVAGLPPGLARQAVTEAACSLRYEGYIARQERLLRRQRDLDEVALPAELDYRGCAALSWEAREKLDRFRPASLGQASRIDGVRAADLAVLTVLVRRHAAEAAPEGDRRTGS